MSNNSFIPGFDDLSDAEKLQLLDSILSTNNNESPPANEQGVIGDTIDMAQRGALQGVGGLFSLAKEFTGYGQGGADYFNNWADEQLGSISQEGIEATQKPLFVPGHDGRVEFGDGITDPRALAMAMAQGVGTLAPTMVAGGGAGLLAKAAGAGAKGMSIASQAGFAGTGGGMAQGMAGQDARATVMAIPDETLYQSKAFLDLWNSDFYDESLDDATNAVKAREYLAESAASEVMRDPELAAVNFGSNLVTGKVFDGLLKGTLGKSRLGNAAVAGVSEMSEEFAQEGTSALKVNAAARKIDPSITNENVLPQALTGAVVGFGVGAPLGLAGRVDAARNDAANAGADPLEQELAASNAAADARRSGQLNTDFDIEAMNARKAELDSLNQAAIDATYGGAQQQGAQRTAGITPGESIEASNEGRKKRLSGIDGDIVILERSGDTEGATILRNATNLYRRAQQLEAAGKTGMANKLNLRADEIVSNFYGQPQGEPGSANTFPAESVSNGQFMPSGPGMPVTSNAGQSSVIDGEVQREPLGLEQSNHKLPNKPKEGEYIPGENLPVPSSRQEGNTFTIDPLQIEKSGTIFADGSPEETARLAAERAERERKAGANTEAYEGQFSPGDGSNTTVRGKKNTSAPEAANQNDVTTNDVTPAGEKPVLQNRDRSTPESISQMRSIASDPDYSRLSFSRDLSAGAPVVEEGADIPKQNLGRKDVATSSNGRKIPVQYAVVEADQLLSSNDINGSPNEGYDGGIAGKSRAIAGNGRVTGLQHAHSSGQGGNYKQEMAADNTHGIDPSVIRGMKNPVLVRVMPSSEITADIGDESNISGVSELSPVEQARNDARRINVAGTAVIGPDGQLTREAAEQFINSMPESERGGLRDGKLPSKRAYERMENAIFAAAFDNDELIRLQAQATDPEARTVMSGLLAAAGPLSRLKGKGIYDVREIVTEAAAIAVNARRQGRSLQEFIQQADMTVSPETLPILQMFAENIRSAKAIGEKLTSLADALYNEATKPEVDMFGAVEKRSPSTLTDEAFNNEQQFDAQGSGDQGGTIANDRANERNASGESAGAGEGRAKSDAEVKPTKSAESAESAKSAKSAESAESAKLTDSFELNQYTEQELADQAKAQADADAAAQSAKSAESAKAQADKDVNDFTLSGSDLPADIASSRGQDSLFDAPKTKDLRGDNLNGEWRAFAPTTGTKNIPRSDMPQVKAEHRGALANFLKARGISSTEETVPASELKPTQAEFSEAKVKKAKAFTGGDRAILVSQDGYVVDGHHQWVAKHDNNEDVRIIRLGAPIEVLLDQVKEFPSADVDQGATGSRTSQEPKAPNAGAAPGGKPGIAPGNQENKPGYGKENKLFTEDAAAKARALLRAKLNGSQLNAGLDPEIVQAGITLAGYHIEAGARAFADFTKAMVADLGEAARPYLRSWYEGVRYYPGMDAEGMSSAADIESGAASETAATDDKTTGLVASLYSSIKNDGMPKDHHALSRLITEIDGEKPSQHRMKQAQEALEAAIVMRARDIVAETNGVKATYDALVALYKSQPNLNIRTSTSVDNQAYSTPAPLAYLAANAAGIDQNTTVFEPTAGNGMLLITASPDNAIANELESGRFANLEEQGFSAMQGDAIEAMDSGAVAPKSVDSVITNPPFGSVKDDNGKATKVRVDGFKIGKIDHLIAARALEAMKDDGTATLIIGADKKAGGISSDDRVFFNWLYSNYNVVGHFEVEGKMYSRQGAGWPVRVISIKGRQESKTFSPAPSTIQRVDSWSSVYEQYESLGTQDTAPESSGAVVDNDSTGAGSDGGPVYLSTGSAASGASGKSQQTGKSGGTRGNTGASSSQSDGLADSDVNVGPNANDTESSGVGPGVEEKLAGKSETTGESAGGTNPAKSNRGAVEPERDGEFQATYQSQSANNNEGILTPVNMAQPLRNALNALEDEVGDIDSFVMRELGYDSIGDLHNALMGLQIDSVAAGISQIKKGKGIVIADQTGVGKGRQAAAIIRYAKRNGKIPIFVSVKPQLFTDMYGDLADIGTHDITPLLLNTDESIVRTNKDGTTEKLFRNKSDHGKVINQMKLSGKLPAGRDALFLTYSQVNRPGPKTAAIMSLAPNAIFIMDESHNAGGDSNTGEFFRNALENAQGVVYLSATYAKRPDNMPLYFKTDIGRASGDASSLIDAMSMGGLSLQTVVSNQLVQAGQMFRRERSYNGVSIVSKVITDRRVEHEQSSDRATEALRAITDADRSFHHKYFKSVESEAKKEGKAAKKAGNQASTTVQHTEFSSVVHNFIRQLLLGLKADATADEVIAAIKRNERPIVAVENTMGSILGEYVKDESIAIGGDLSGLSYRTLLMRALERSRRIKWVLPNGDEEIIAVPLNDLDPATRQSYLKAMEVIENLDLDIPASPIDHIRARIGKAGYSVKEITGRKQIIDYSGATPTLAMLDASERNDRVQTTKSFNDGKTDALILNVAGSTGISLHSSEKFGDTRPRHMIVAQAAQDINVFMQMLGRIHRTGQVNLPRYTILSADLPSEKRPTAILALKMKSLNANTSSNTESATSVDAVDILNKYGDEVIDRFLGERPAWGLVLRLTNADTVGTGDLARKVTGRMALMAVEGQYEFYEEIETQYTEMIEFLNKTGQNDLIPRTYDYDAQEVYSQTIVDETDASTPFGRAAYYNEFSIKAQGKPLTVEEVAERIEKRLDGKTADEFNEDLIARDKKDFDSALARISPDSDIYADVKANRESVRRTAQDLMEENKIGTALRLDINGDAYYGVVTNISNSHKKGASGNPYSLSKINFTMAVNGALRSITVPASQLSKIRVARMSDPVAQLWAENDTEARSIAKIITGNLLAAYAELKNSGGTIIHFTKSDGTTEQGILLKKTFEPADNLRNDYRFKSGKDAVKFLQEAKSDDRAIVEVFTRDSNLRIKLDDAGTMVIRAPKSKAKGGTYFLDPAIRKVVGDFVSLGASMVAKVPPGPNQAKAVDAVLRKAALYTLPSLSGEARSVLGESQLEVKGERAPSKPASVVPNHVRGQAPASAPAQPRTNSNTAKPSFDKWEAEHSKTGDKLYMAGATARVSKDEFFALKDKASKHNGYWSRFGKAGFLFKTAADRDAFVNDTSDDSGIVYSRTLSKSGATPKGVGLGSVKIAINRFLKQYKGANDVTVKVFRTHEEAHGKPAPFRTKGGYDPETDTLFIYTEALDSIADLQETLQHELLVHKGLGFIDPVHAADFLASLRSAAKDSPELAAVLDEVERVEKGRSDQLKAEEILARIAQEKLSLPNKIWNRIVLALQRLLKRAGFKVDVSAHRQAKDMVYRIGDAFAEGKRAPRRDTEEMFNDAGGTPVDTREAAFKRWFGKSKVVDDNGDPIVMYHGTPGDFSSFEKGEVNSRYPYSIGFHFSTNPKEASAYTREGVNVREYRTIEGSNVMPVYLKAENPLIIKTKHVAASMEADLNRKEIKATLAEAERNGNPYDSVIIKTTHKPENAEYDHWNVIVFEPGQIKSATGNNGAFDPSNPDIRYSRDGLDMSKAARMKRAKAMGFDTSQVLYHGTDSEFDSFEPGRAGLINLAVSKEYASSYGEIVGEYFIKLPKGKVFDWVNNPAHRAEAIKLFNDAGGWEENLEGDLEYAREEFGRKDFMYDPEIDKGWEIFDNPDTDILYQLQEQGYEVFIYDESDGSTAYATANPSNIRSVNAAFNENEASSDNLFYSRTAEVDPARASVLEKIGLAQDTRTPMQKMREGISEWWSELFSNFIPAVADKFHDLKKINAEAYMRARMSTNTGAALAAALGHATPEWHENGLLKAKRGSKGLLEILKRVDGESNEWIGWMVGKRAQNLMDQGRENLLTEEDIAALLDVTPEQAQRFQQTADEWQAYNGAMLDIMAGGGLITQEDADHFKQDPYYIPFYRESLDDTGEVDIAAPFTKKGLSHQKDGIEALKGGTANLQDPLKNMLMNVSRAIDASVKNNALRRIIDEVNPGADNPILTPALEGNRSGPSVIRVRRDGENEWYRVHDLGVLGALTAMNDIQTSALTRALGIPKRLLTAGVTATPTFMLRNAVRDITASWVQSEDVKWQASKALGQFRDALKIDDDTLDMMMAGSAFMGGYRYSNDATSNADALREQLRAKGMSTGDIDGYMSSLWDGSKSKWEWYREKGERFENMARLKMFKDSLASGHNYFEAAYKSKDLMDFSLHGRNSIMHFLIQTVPFMNARIQGLYKLGRVGGNAWREAELRKLLLTKGIMLAGASLALLWLNDDEERYQELPDWDKDANWHLFFENEHIRIPKPFELGLVFGTLPERTVRMAKGDDDARVFFNSMSTNVLSTLSMNPVPQALMPIGEAAFNYDLFRRRTIDNMSDLGNLPGSRKSNYTSEIAKGMGGIFESMGITGDMASPKRIDHIIKGYTGSMGISFLSAIDGIVHMASGNTMPAMNQRDYPVLGWFARGDDPVGTKYSDDFYRLMERANQAYRTARDPNTDSDRRQEILEEYAPELRARQLLGKTSKALSNLRKQRDVVYRDNSLTAEQKRDRLNRIQELTNTLQKRAVDIAGK